MNLTLKIDELEASLLTICKIGKSVEIISPPGRGKSSLMLALKQRIIAAAGGNPRACGMATLFLATQTPPDLIGYIMKGEHTYKKDGDDITIPVSEATMPSWMRDDETGLPCWEFDFFIVFMDEYGQGEGDVKRASAELFLNGKIGPWKLPKGKSIVFAASNRAEDRSGVTRSFDFVINRRIEVHMADSVEASKRWALKANKLAAFITFMEEHPEIVFSQTVPEQQGPWCTPRTLFDYAEPIVREFSPDLEELNTSDLVMTLVAGVIGEPAMAQLFTHIRLHNHVPKYEEIIKHPKATPVPDAADAKMMVMHKLAHNIEPEDLAPAVTYMERVGKEFAVTFMRTALQRKPRLLHQDAAKGWMKENSQLINAIGQMNG